MVGTSEPVNIGKVLYAFTNMHANAHQLVCSFLFFVNSSHLISIEKYGFHHTFFSSCTKPKTRTILQQIKLSEMDLFGTK